MSFTTDVTTIRIALAGCGTVGGALLDLFATHGEELVRRRALRFEVTRILVRDTGRPRSSQLDRALLTDDLSTFLASPADVVVEALGGLQPAHAIAEAALTRGLGFVTANKVLVRATGPALAARAARRRAEGHAGALLEFEAAVGGGMPIVRLLRESLAGHGVRRIRGVLNGTTTHILTRIEAGASFAEALRAAQCAGFAESDPSRDLDGLDAADKIALLAWLAFGVDPATLDVDTRGLPDDLDGAVRAAAARGERLRLVATAALHDGVVRASVGPESLLRTDALACAIDEENLVQVESHSAGAITLSGRGAGGAATASALLADLIHLFQPSPV